MWMAWGGVPPSRFGYREYLKYIPGVTSGIGLAGKREGQPTEPRARRWRQCPRRTLSKKLFKAYPAALPPNHELIFRSIGHGPDRRGGDCQGRGLCPLSGVAGGVWIGGVLGVGGAREPAGQAWAGVGSAIIRWWLGWVSVWLTIFLRCGRTARPTRR